MNRYTTFMLATAASASLASAATAQTLQAPGIGPNWRLELPPPHVTLDPRAEEFRRWMDAMRSYAESNGTRIPPASGTLPHAPGTARDITELMMQFRPPVALPAIVDGNHDGVVSDEEAAGHAEAVFAALDTDGNRALSPQEVERRQVLVLFAQPQEAEPEESARFTALDGNADGSVSKAEFLDVARAHYEEARDPVTETVTPWSYRRTDWF